MPFLLTLSLFFIAVAVIVSMFLTAGSPAHIGVEPTAQQVEKGDLAARARVRGKR
jgi:hypothetical protein